MEGMEGIGVVLAIVAVVVMLAVFGPTIWEGLHTHASERYRASDELIRSVQKQQGGIATPK